MNSPPPEILLITRPLTPPWDEASKNLAYAIAKDMTDFKFHILVGKYDATLPKHITQHLIYKGADWTTPQKMRLILNLKKILKQNPGINSAHLLFAPTPLNTRILRSILKKFKLRVIQNLACPPKKNTQKILFGDQIVSYSNYTAQKTGLKNVTVIPPFIDAEKFVSLSKKARNELRQKWGIGKNDRVLLFPGEYSRLNALGVLWKGYTGLISNASCFMPHASLKLFIACRIKNKRDLALEKKFKKLIEISSHKDSVQFLGKIEKPEEMYQIADLTVFPVKKMDGKFDFPFVLLESLACGTPILTSDVGALPEIWRGKKESKKKYVFKINREEDFAKKAGVILEEERGSEKLSQFVRENFGKEEILEKYSDLYKNI